ncbi:MAG: hypothetical protein ACFCBW_00680 [Candidatus Competibacterales bacterium]
MANLSAFSRYCPILALTLAASASAQTFDFGLGQCDPTAPSGGNDSFERYIDRHQTVTLGTLPEGVVDVEIYLTAQEDLDIQLTDKTTGQRLIHWPNGLLNGPSLQQLDYHGMRLEWSGYNGDGHNYGNEYIRITGATTRELEMRVYGYAAGYAVVDYAWAERVVDPNQCQGQGVAPRGHGTFTRTVPHQDIITLGELPPGVRDVYIELRADRDIDVQLQDATNGQRIVHWPNGLLNGPGRQTVDYYGMTIEWSGYNGDGHNLGHEYIRIRGEITRPLTMRVYGYQHGPAVVNYWWGYDDGAPVNQVASTVTMAGFDNTYQEVDVLGHLPNLCWATGPADFTQVNDVLLAYIPITAEPSPGAFCAQAIYTYDDTYFNQLVTIAGQGGVEVQRVYAGGRLYRCHGAPGQATVTCTPQ